MTDEPGIHEREPLCPECGERVEYVQQKLKEFLIILRPCGHQFDPMNTKTRRE